MNRLILTVLVLVLAACNPIPPLDPNEIPGVSYESLLYFRSFDALLGEDCISPKISADSSGQPVVRDTA